MIYFGTRLSENISRREPEGYLLCLNVPVARTGTQEYLPEELGLPPDGDTVPVFRPPEEVFDPACIASFEGMPVTDDHPRCPEGVNATNIRYLQKGHAHHVRRGEGAESDLLLADLIITDPDLAERILNGKREISCGYNYTLREEDGGYVQREIRGNHIAVVDAGRAGPRVSIKDAKKERRTNPMNKTETRKTTPTRFHRRTAKLMARMARDGETEELAEMISEIMTPDEDPVVAEPENPVTEVVEEILKPEAAGDEELSPVEESAVVTLLREIVSLLKSGAADACGNRDACDPTDENGSGCDACGGKSRCGDEEDPLAESLAEAVTGAVTNAEFGYPPVSDPMEELVSRTIEEALNTETDDEELIVTGEPEETLIASIPDPDDPNVVILPDRAADALRGAMSAFRPILKSMAPAARRQAVAKIAANLKAADMRKRAGDNNYVRLAGSGAARREDPADLGKRIMAARNINYKK